MHLLSETAKWITKSEFVSPKGIITRANGETNIVIGDKYIENHSWVLWGESKRVNNYRITLVSCNEYQFESLNPELGIQEGMFNIDRNTVFSKFTIKDTNLNGFEIITRQADTCYVNGALYNDNKLINTWNATMVKA